MIPEHWNLEDLKAMVSWFKCPGDSMLPTTKAKLLKQYALTMNRSKEERSHLKEGEDAIVEEDENGITGGMNNQGCVLVCVLCMCFFAQVFFLHVCFARFNGVLELLNLIPR